MATTKKKNDGLSGAAAAAARVALGDAGKVTSSATTSRKSSTRTSSGSSSGNTVRNRTNGIDYTISSGNGIYGVPTINSEKKNYTQNGVTYKAGPIMNRVTDPDIIKNGYYNSNGYTVFVDEDGYAHSASKGVSDYTPHLDINAGNGRYNTSGAWTDNEVLTASDLQKIADIRSQMQAGLITGDKANQMANQIRSGYGYTIDKQGNVTDLLAKSRVDSRRQAWELPTNGMSTEQQNFLNLMFPEQQGYGNEALLSALSGLQNGYQTPYSDAPTWNGSEWDNVLNALADQLLNMNYTDWTKGDQYQALADRYGQQGKLSMQDVLGQISSKTGGLASSYAATAAQQQYNSFMSQLEDAAMDMYNVERNDLYDRANMARQYAQDDYDRYVDDYNRWENDRNYQYQLNRDAIEDSRYDQEWQYQQDQLARQQAEDQAHTLAKYGDFSGYKALGYTDAQIALMEAAYQMQNTKKSGGGGGGGGNDTVSQDYNGLFRAAYDAGDNAKSFIANNYGDYGFDKSTGLYEEFTEAAKTPVRSGFEMNASNFNATMQSISAQLQAGKTDAAESNVNRVWDQLSSAQKAQLQSLLSRYGLAAE